MAPWERQKHEGKKKFAKLSFPGIKPIHFIILLLLLFGGIAFYFYDKYQKAENLLGESIVAENQKAIDEVASLVEVPPGTPRVTTIEDAGQFAGQEFFSRAQNGDKVLVYVQAQKAILYRPSTGKIIEIAPIIPTTPTPIKITPTTAEDSEEPEVPPTESPVSPTASSE